MSVTPFKLRFLSFTFFLLYIIHKNIGFFNSQTVVYPVHSPAENAGLFHKGDCGGGRAYRKGGLQTP